MTTRLALLIVLSAASGAAASGDCKDNLGIDEQGRQRRCCSPETQADYFLDADGRNRNCPAQWANTGESCRLGDRDGSVWTCATRTQALGHCKNNVGTGEDGHQTRCCRSDTNAVYFLDPSTGKNRNCQGRWENTGKSCALRDLARSPASVWRCDAPERPEDDDFDEDLTEHDPGAVERITQAAMEKYRKAYERYRRGERGQPMDLRLIDYAALYGSFQKEWYRREQLDVLGPDADVPACNYFVITSMARAGLWEFWGPRSPSGTRKAGSVLAEHFDDRVLRPEKGWHRVTPAVLKALLSQGRAHETVLQRDGTKMGHVAIPIGLSKDGVVVAEGIFNSKNHAAGVWNRVSTWGHGRVLGFNIFVRPGRREPDVSGAGR